MLAATLAAAVLAACGEPQLVELPAEFQGATDLPVEPPPTPVITNGAPATAPRGPVSVNLGIASGSPVAARLESLVHGAVADATAANPDLDLNVVQIAVGQGLQFRNDPAALIDAVDSALGDRGRLDLLIVATRGDLLWLQAEGLIQPLDRFFSAGSGSIDDYYPAGRQLVAFDGHSWALPLALVPTVLWYGEQQFATAGVDPPPAEGWTWADFRTAAADPRARRRRVRRSVGPLLPRQRSHHAGGQHALRLAERRRLRR